MSNLTCMEMNDENGNCIDHVFATIIEEERIVKKIKCYFEVSEKCNMNVAIHRSENHSELMQCAPLRRSQRLSRQGPLGHFCHLPLEIMFLLFDYLPLESVGKLGQTSKPLRDIAVEWMNGALLHARLISPFITMESISPLNHYQTSFPKELLLKCHQVGLFIKRVTCLFPTIHRLKLYFQLITKLKKTALKKAPHYPKDLMTACAGVILHTFIAGWDKSECIKVYSLLSNWFHITRMMSDFFKDRIGENANNEHYLQLHIRYLFLDFCCSSDRPMWMNIIFSTTTCPSKRARLLLLLYGPHLREDGVEWEFPLNIEDIAMYTSTFRTLATVIGSLRYNSKDCSINDILRLLTSVSETPTEWPLRSLASLLLPLHSVDSTVVARYFSKLCSENRIHTVAELISEIMVVCQNFHSESTEAHTEINSSTVLSLIRNAVDYNFNRDNKYDVIGLIWEEVQDLTERLFHQAMITEDTTELQSLIETWKDISILLSL